MAGQPETQPETPKTRVVIAGGGVAALEAVIALRKLAGHMVGITMVAPDDHFVYQPLSVGDPFALGPAKRYPLARVAEDLDITLQEGSLAAVDHEARTIRSSDGGELSYDALLVAVGAGREPAYEHALTFRGQEDGERAHGLVQDLEGGYGKRIVFVVPPGTAWSLPLYELALMTAGRAREMSIADAEISIVTPEETPLAVFGVQASADVAKLLDEAGVTLKAGVHAEVERSGEVKLRPSGETLSCDRIVALPRIVARRIDGLPAGENGFIPIDEHARVPGTEQVWAAGDGTTFPVKQGGIACQQADAAAQDIAQRAGADVVAEPFRPVLRGQLMTGSEPHFMRHHLEGGHGEDSEVSTHNLWRPPSKIAGVYLAPYLGELPAAGPEREPEVPLAVSPSGEAGSRIWI
ncbi:MAG: sulfide:quinone oxidoreductase [Gaiellales bacterium]|jgi:sulfide:quinone oxidoreductase|nr:sulfide:quinone oxidoreductase [Gaiellales bacterium]